MGTWEHRAILEGNKGTRTPPGRPSLFVCDTGVDAIPRITSINALHLATKQFGQLCDGFGVHCDEKNVEAASVLPFVDNAE